jgi:hypothetical protein
LKFTVDNSLGAVFVYEYLANETKFVLHSQLNPEIGQGTYFGVSVSVVNNTVAVGAPGYNLAIVDLVDDESTYAPTISPTIAPSVSPSQAPTASPSLSMTPSVIPSEAPSQAPFSPTEVPTQAPSLPTARRLVGITGLDTTGYVYLFTFENSSSAVDSVIEGGKLAWNLTQVIVSPGGQGSHFGFSVSLSKSDLIVGAPGLRKLIFAGIMHGDI